MKKLAYVATVSLLSIALAGCGTDRDNNATGTDKNGTTGTNQSYRDGTSPITERNDSYMGNGPITGTNESYTGNNNGTGGMGGIDNSNDGLAGNQTNGMNGNVQRDNNGGMYSGNGNGKGTSNTNRNVENADDVARKVESLDDVDDAYVLVTNNNAYIAVKLKQGVKSDKALEDRIADTVRKNGKNYNNVYVSMNPDAAMQFSDYGNRIRGGQSVEGFFDEFTDALGRMFPNAR